MKESRALRRMLTRRFYAVAAVLWALFILYALLTPGSSVPLFQIWMGDKIIHAILFFVQMALLWKGISQGALSSRRASGYAFLITVAFGIATELLQLMAVERSADILDAVADTVGALLFLALIIIGNSRRKKQA